MSELNIPHNPQNEQAVLSAMIAFPGCIDKVNSIMDAADHHDETHRIIHSTINTHDATGKPVELPALAATLGKNRQAVETMAALLDIATTGETAPYYARQIKKASQARQIQALAMELQHHPERAAEIIPCIEELSPVESKAEPVFISAGEFLKQTASIDYLIDGLIEADSTGLIFGASGGGKTFNALEIALTISAEGASIEH